MSSGAAVIGGGARGARPSTEANSADLTEQDLLILDFECGWWRWRAKREEAGAKALLLACQAR